MSIRSRITALGNFGPTAPNIRDRSGQAALLVGMLTFTFLLFVAFVLNIGMLVNAKINLQNAADMAALAGAGSQARHLNHIAFLNYEMRRQYKKFLFRQHVIGTLAYDDAPGTPGAPTAGQRVYTNVGKPVTCLIFLPTDNVCRNTEIKGFKIPTGNPLDNLQNTFKDTVKQFESARQENCVLASTLNRAAVALWLLNTDPNLKNVSESLRSLSGADAGAASAVRAMETIQAVANGLGVYPREFLLRSRVRTLQAYVNESGKTGVTLEDMEKFQGDIDPMAHERTILAYMSAFKSLGEGTFSSSENITLDEMLPPAGNGGADLLGLDPIEVQFDNYHSEFELVDNNRGDGSKDCVRKLVPTLGNLPLPVGFTKQLDKLVYYAVRVTADAKLLFNPFGGSIRMSAYAAAQPFGSRIGPQVGESEFTVEDRSSETGLAAAGDPCRENGGLFCFNKRSQMELAPGIDFDSYAFQIPLVQMTQVDRVVTFGGIQTAVDAAMTPSLSEIGKYTFPNDLPNDEKIQKFFDEPAAVINGKPTYAFWAPVLSPAKLATSSAEQALQEIFSGGAVNSGQTASTGTTVSQGGSNVTAAFVQAFTDSIGRYVASLREGLGENGEGFNVVRLTNPFPNSETGRLPPNIAMTTAKQARTSWNQPRDPDMISAGRVGYSIKLVPLKMLRNAESGSGVKPTTNNSGANWDNLLPGVDSRADADLEAIEH